MQLVRSTLRDQRNLPARRASFIRARSAHGHAEFLNRIEWNRQYGIEPRIDLRAIRVRPLVSARTRGRGLRSQSGILVVVHVGSIERDVVLIAPCTEHLSRRRDTDLQAQKLDDITLD